MIEDIKVTEENPFSHKIIEELKKYNREQKNKTNDAAALLNLTFSYPV